MTNSMIRLAATAITAVIGKTPKFEVTQASSTLTGLQVSISRE